jgi:hypothetical protein
MEFSGLPPPPVPDRAVTIDCPHAACGASAKVRPPPDMLQLQCSTCEKEYYLFADGSVTVGDGVDV